MTTTRRLAAILAADVAGYSRLMAADEDGTLARFKLLRFDHFEPAIRARGGRVVGEAGDSLLVEFGSATEAVACALEVQEKLAALNAELPAERRMMFRIGINLGEVVVDGGTIHGDGVNVAARLEKLAEPGGICLSRAVHEQVRGRISSAFQDMGDQALHNIAAAVRVYRIGPEATPPAPPSPSPHSAAPKTTVAVLPFSDLSGDGTLATFCDGISEDLITALAMSRNLAVIARNTTFRYRGQAVEVRDVARELGADYVLEGSVRGSGDRVRVTAQLIDAATGAHVWAQRYDRAMADPFAVQDDVVAAIAAQLVHNLVDVSAGRQASGTKGLSAYEYLLKGRAAWRRGAVLETLDHYRKSERVDPTYAPALAALAFYYTEDQGMQVTGLSPGEREALTRHYIERATAHNDGDPYAYHMIGTAFLGLGELDRARHHLELARSLNPYFNHTPINLGCTIAFMGHHTEGLAMIENAFWLEPRLAPAMRAVLIYCHYLARNHESAAASFHRLDAPGPDHLLLYAISLAQLGRHEECARALVEYQRLQPNNYDPALLANMFITMSRLPEDKEHWRDGFRKAGFDV